MLIKYKYFDANDLFYKYYGSDISKQKDKTVNLFNIYK